MSDHQPHQVFHHVALDADEERPEVGDAKELLLYKQVDQAIAALEPITQDECDDYMVFEVLGIAYAQRGSIMAAVGALETAARLNPVQPHVNFNLGQVLRRSGDLAGAKEAYEHALRTDPTYGRARNALASMQPKPAAP